MKNLDPLERFLAGFKILNRIKILHIVQDDDQSQPVAEALQAYIPVARDISIALRSKRYAPQVSSMSHKNHASISLHC